MNFLNPDKIEAGGMPVSYTIYYDEEMEKTGKRKGKLFASLGVMTIFTVCLLAFGLTMPKQLQQFR
jgi:hypothetical protein